MAERRPFFSFINLNFFKMHPLLKPYNLFDINGVAILRGFHDTVVIRYNTDPWGS